MAGGYGPGGYVLSPAMQMFLAGLLRITMSFRSKLDGDRYLENLWILYMNLPPEAKKAVDNTIASDPELGKYGGSLRELIDGLEKECSRYIKQYEQFKDPYDKREECRMAKIAVGDKVLTAMTSAMYSLGLFTAGAPGLEADAFALLGQAD